MLLGFGRSNPALLLGGELNVGSCPDHLEPMERQEHDGKPSDDQPIDGPATLKPAGMV